MNLFGGVWCLDQIIGAAEQTESMVRAPFLMEKVTLLSLLITQT